MLALAGVNTTLDVAIQAKDKHPGKGTDGGTHRVAGVDLVPVVQLQVVALLLHDRRDVIAPEDPHPPAKHPMILIPKGL